MGNHTETVQLTYDSSKVTWEELVSLFWEEHNPTVRRPRQYMSIIFCHDGEQEALARESLKREEERRKTPLVTEIVPLDGFFRAEDYHQKYFLQGQKKVITFVKELFSSFDDFVGSTLAARLNGFAAGYGDPVSTGQELMQLGVAPEEAEKIMGLMD